MKKSLDDGLDIERLLKELDADISKKTAGMASAASEYRHTPEAGAKTGVVSSISKEEVFRRAEEAVYRADVGRSVEFEKRQIKLEKKYPESAECVRLFKAYLRDTVYKAHYRSLTDEDRKTDEETRFRLDSPCKLVVLNFDETTHMPAFSKPEIEDDKMWHKEVLKKVSPFPYSAFTGEYLTLPFLGGEVLQPVDAYIGNTGRVIFRFFEVRVEGEVRVTARNEIVEIKQESIDVLDGFAALYESVLSDGETKSGESEFKELMDVIKLNSSEEQGSW